jgi:hypothetical protein
LAVAERLNDNSPAFQCRELFGVAKVPQGRLNERHVLPRFQGQEAHHRKMTFQEEFLALLKKHRIEYDDRYLWK